MVCKELEVEGIDRDRLEGMLNRTLLYQYILLPTSPLCFEIIGIK